MPRTITRDEVKARIDAGGTIVVEALPVAHYTLGKQDWVEAGLALEAGPARPNP